MIVSCSDAPATFDAVEKTLYPVSHRIRGPVCYMLDMPILLGGYFGHAAPGTNVVPDGIAMVTLVSMHEFGVGVVVGHQAVERCAVVGLARRQKERDGKILSVGLGVEFGRNPPPYQDQLRIIPTASGNFPYALRPRNLAAMAS